MHFFVTFFFTIFMAFGAYAQIINIEERRIRGTADSIHWYGHCNFGGSLTKIKETIASLNADLQMEYKKGTNLVLSLSNYNFVKAGQKSFINSGFQHLRYNRKIKKDSPHSWELFAQAQNNQIQTMRLRALAGAGLRLRLLMSANRQSRLYFGMSYMREYNEYKNDGATNYNRISSYISMTYRPTKTTLFQNTTYFQPSLPRFDARRWSSETDVEFKITEKVSFRCAFNLAYDGTVPLTLPRRTYNLSNGIKWRL